MRGERGREREREREKETKKDDKKIEKGSKREIEKNRIGRERERNR